MRNTLQEQYNLINEGKGSKDMFMRTALRQFPHLVTPTLSFDMTVDILKQRQVISETIGGIVTKGKTPDWHSIFKENITEETKKIVSAKQNGDKSYTVEYSDGTTKKIYVSNDAWDEINDKYGKPANLKEKEDDDDAKYDEMIKRYEDEKDAKYTLPNIGNLREAKEVKAKIAKTDADVIAKETAGYDYKDKKNYDNVYGQEFLVGYYTEMKDPKNTEKTVDELKKIVAKNLESDSSYYVKKGQFGVKDLGYMDNHPGLGPTKEVTGKYKSSGMEPIKIKESIIKKIDFLIKEGLDLKEIETVAEVAALEAKMSKVMKEKEKREKKIKALETLSEMDKEVVSKEGMNTLKKEVKLLEKMAADIEKKQDKLKGIKKEVLTSTDEALDYMSETEETED
jgi:hypothetical protein